MLILEKSMRLDWNNNAIQWIILIVVGFIWGTSYILMKKGLESYSPGQVASIRLTIASIAMLPISINHLKKLKRENFLSLAIASLCGIGIPAFLFTNAQTHVSSAIAGLLNSLSPLFTLVIGFMFYKSKATLTSLLGVIIGLVGASLLVIKSKGLSVSEFNGYALLIVLATICYGINSNEIKFKLSNLTGTEITSLIFILLGPLALLYLFISGFNPAQLTHQGQVSLAYIAILALFGSVVAVLAYNQLLKHVSPVSASSVSYISPIFAIMWGFFDGESFGVGECIALIAIILGVYLVNKNKVYELAA